MTYEQFCERKVQNLVDRRSETYGRTGLRFRLAALAGVSMLSLSLAVSCTGVSDGATADQVKGYQKCNDPKERVIKVKTSRDPLVIDKEQGKIEYVDAIPVYNDANDPEGSEVSKIGTNKSVTAVERGFPPSGNSGSIRYAICGSSPGETTFVNGEHLDLKNRSDANS